MPLTVRGVIGEVRWSYHLAGTVRAWTIAKEPDGARTLSASLVKADTYRIAQRPLVFVAPHAKGAWRWPIVELQIVDGSLSATLGPLET